MNKPKNKKSKEDDSVLNEREEIIKRLSSGDIYEWNDWRKEYPDLQIDLSGVNLSN